MFAEVPEKNWLGKKPLCPLPILNRVKEFQSEKTGAIFLVGPFFHMLLGGCLLKFPNSKKTENSPALNNFWLRACNNPPKTRNIINLNIALLFT